MSKIYFQGTYGAYSHLAALSIDSKAEIIPCKTFDECFLKALNDPSSKIIIPESNRITGNIGIEYLIFKYRLNIYSEYFQKIEHNLLGLSGTKISDIKDVYSHAQALSQCSKFIKSHNLVEHIRADTAGSAEMISKNKNKEQAAIASSLSAETYGLEIIKKNIENEKGNFTRFLIMGKNIFQPEFSKKKEITQKIEMPKIEQNTEKKNLSKEVNNETINQIKNVIQEKKNKPEQHSETKALDKIQIESFENLLTNCAIKKEMKLKYELENND